MPKTITLTNKFASQLRQEIRAGRWTAEEPIPSERALAEKYGISRVTARRSLRLLCGERLIEARPARGYFVIPGAAEAMAQETSRAVLFVQRGLRDNPTLDPMHTAIVNGALAEANGTGIEIYIICQEPADFRKTVREQWGRRLRGVLLDWSRPDLARILLAEDVPFVMVETDMEEMGTASVIQDNAGGVRLALEHLFEYGHRKIGLILGEDEDGVHAGQRLAGYREFLLRRGLPGDPGWVERGALDAAGGRRAAVAVLEAAEQPTALLVCHREMLSGVTEELAARGMAYPEDISVVVWGEGQPGEPGGEFTDITHVAWSKEEMGRLAMRALEERIKVGHPERIVLKIETRLVDCGSVAAPTEREGKK